MTDVPEFVKKVEAAIAETNPAYQAMVERNRRIDAAVERVRALLKERLRAGERSQLEVARELGIDPSAVSRGLSGKGDLGLKTLLRYAAAIQTDPVEILSLALAQTGQAAKSPDLPVDELQQALAGPAPVLTDPLTEGLLRQTMMAELSLEKRQQMVEAMADLLGVGPWRAAPQDPPLDPPPDAARPQLLHY